jgi:GNAT superfamily N-acetyltransferase
MTEYHIETCTKENIKKIVDGIKEYNQIQVPALSDIWTPLEFMIRDSEGVVIGGVLGGIGSFKGLEIRILWVSEEYRKSGLGSKILNHIENVAIEKGATISMLDTFDFQAEGFYIKNGYSVFGEIHDFPKGHRRIYLSKRFYKKFCYEILFSTVIYVILNNTSN